MHASPIFWREKWVKNDKNVICFEAGQPEPGQFWWGGGEGLDNGLLQCGAFPCSGFPGFPKQVLWVVITGDQVPSPNHLGWALGGRNNCGNKGERRESVAGGGAEAGHDLHKHLQNALPKRRVSCPLW